MKTLPNWDDPSRVGKKLTRQEAFSGVGYARTGIFMPGSQCACVRAALEAGVLDFASRIIAVERDKAIAAEMELRLSLLGVSNCYLHRDALAKLQLNEPIDFAFFDFLGTLTFENAAWLSNVLSPHILPGATIVVTLSTNPRGSKFLPDCRDVFENELFDQTCELAGTLECFNYEIVNAFALFKCIFNQWHFRPVLRVKYRDSGSASMCCYKLVDFRPVKSSGWPSLSKFMVERQKYDMTNLNGLEKLWVREIATRSYQPRPKLKYGKTRETKEKYKNPIMVEAGKKSWITRRSKNVAIFL